MSNYKIIYEKILNKPANVEIQEVGKSGSEEYASSPNQKNETIQNIFEISEVDKELFDTAFRQVALGKGKEANRITTLHSSSLLGLLAFFRVPNHPISIQGIEGIVFDKCYFEVESKVINSNSSIDVLLVSNDENTLLFLELKFTELLTPSTHYWVESKYKREYSSLSQILKNADIKVGQTVTRKHVPRDKKKSSYKTNEFKISSYSSTKHYFAGIKQMISHAIGLMRSPLSGNKDLKQRYLDGKSPRIILATMVYDSSGCDSCSKAYNDYVEIYNRIFSQSAEIKECIKKSKQVETDIEILDKPLTYQDIISINEESPFIPKVRQVYRL